MKTTTDLSEELKNIFLNPVQGISRVADDLLKLCQQHRLEIDWQAKGCRVRSSDGQFDELIDMPIRTSVFRALLARLAVHCNEQNPDGVSPYGGRGEFSVEAVPAAVFKLDFSNTASEQNMVLRPEFQVNSETFPQDMAGAEADTNPTFRAWVMIKRNRCERFYQAELELQKLVQDANEHKGVIKNLYSFYGEYDLVIPLEAGSLSQIQKTVSMIEQRGGDAGFSTITSVVVDPAFDNRRRFGGQQVCIGIITKLGEQNAVRGLLEQIPCFDLADVVFGEFDIIALFHPDPGEPGALEDLREAIREVKSIQKTTTMLPHEIALM